MTSFYQLAVDWLDRAIDDICLLFDRVLGALMAVTAVLFTVMGFFALFG